MEALAREMSPGAVNVHLQRREDMWATLTMPCWLHPATALSLIPACCVFHRGAGHLLGEVLLPVRKRGKNLTDDAHRPEAWS